VNWITYAGNLLWGLWAWLSFALGCLFSLVVALIVPGQQQRQRMIAWASRMVFVLARVKVTIRGMEHLPPDSCVVVANHASYIDGVLLNGYLPARFRLVVKGEMRDVPVAHFLLRRAGSKFVERKEASGSSRDARQLVKAAQGGESLAFFPEGTFRCEPGVARFRAGAFMAAVKGDMPVVPIAISGSREMLPSGRLLLRRANLVIDVLPAIAPGDEHFSSPRHLAEICRQRVLEALDEPDLQNAGS
jgi:1-acyl-sn-glycerol-3-phosphate acyltransferase